jgi:hypothetical protein
MAEPLTLDREQRDEIFAAIAAITAELKRLVASGPGHEQTAMAIGTSLASIHASLTAAADPTRHASST